MCNRRAAVIRGNTASFRHDETSVGRAFKTSSPERVINTVNYMRRSFFLATKIDPGAVSSENSLSVLGIALSDNHLINIVAATYPPIVIRYSLNCYRSRFLSATRYESVVCPKMQCIPGIFAWQSSRHNSCRLTFFFAPFLCWIGCNLTVTPKSYLFENSVIAPPAMR